MTRPIKFRAKILEGGGWKHHEKWVYGLLFKAPITMENGEAEYLKGGKTQWHIVTESGAVWEIDITTVGQFTVLLDKNGKEIYEGDVVKHKADGWEHTGQIKYQVSDCMTCTHFVILDRIGGISQHAHGKEIEIIGNIYENPELIK